MSLGSQIAYYRKKKEMTQAELAEIMNVSFQAVSSWERDECTPEVTRLVELSRALGTSVGRLLEENRLPAVENRKKIFDEERMYTFAKTMVHARELYQTARVLPYVRQKHAGQTRKGEQRDVPYIHHPLTMVCEALSMRLYDDDILSALLLHDVVEDTDTPLDDLPVDDEVKNIVRLVTKDPNPSDKAAAKKKYYEEIARNPKAAFVKCIDRQNNLSNMALGFSRDKMSDYVVETEKYIVPLFRIIKDYAPEYNNAAWLISYHIYSLLETYKRLL